VYGELHDEGGEAAGVFLDGEADAALATAEEGAGDFDAVVDGFVEVVVVLLGEGGELAGGSYDR